MSAASVLTAETRAKAGTSTARSIRHEGMVVGNIYGEKKESLMIAIEPKSFHTSYGPGFFNRVHTINLNGQKHEVIAKHVQLHPVTDVPLHVEFQRVSKNSTIHVSIPLHFINEDKSPGIKKGGMLNVVVHSLEIICPVHSIPEEFSISLEGLEINAGIHIEDIKLPTGAVAAHPERDRTIANIVPPAAEEKATA
jgi:large subunit ribosomal protein L25